MRLVWDERKREANRVKHGMDFADLDLAFFESAVIRTSYAARFLALGRDRDGKVIAVVFRPLGTEAISLISLRRARADERRLLDG